MKAEETGLDIRLLGTGAAWPCPRVGCPCDQCKEAQKDSSHRRRRSVALIGGTILVDSGPDIHWQLLDLPPESISRLEAIVITHVHADHYLGLDDLSRALRDFHDKPLPVYCLADNWPYLERTFSFLFVGGSGARSWEIPRFQHRSLELDQPHEIGGMTLTPFDTHHTRQFTTCGIACTRDSSRIVYSPDAAKIESSAAQEADIFVIDATELDTSNVSHFSIADAARTARDHNARRTVLTHLGHYGVDSNVVRERAKACQVEVAHDGLHLQVAPR
ncbi:MAG: MBL fold metallo-hydrolase [Planctomycetota bacterium]|nr:MBL fold metallo-hydrolase [Planctomycetota bacterium]